MKNSRKDGTLVVKCNKPYIMSVDGHGEERYIVICKEFNHHCEYIAMDLSQALQASIFAMPKRDNLKISDDDSQRQKEDEDKAEKYYNNECPSVAEVEEDAALIEMMLSMNIEVKISYIAEKFVGLVLAGLIKMENGKSMPYQLFSQLHIKDKLKIMFCYISFFVNPLQNLVSLSTTLMDRKDMQGQTKKLEMPSGSAT